MRRDGLWNPRLVQILTSSGHGDLIVIADAGLPVPAGIETVDLVWRAGEPAFLPVVRAVLEECIVEHATIADEVTEPALRSGLTDALAGIPIEHVSHKRLKKLSGRARAVIRTGSTTPYSNVVLRCGVAF